MRHPCLIKRRVDVDLDPRPCPDGRGSLVRSRLRSPPGQANSEPVPGSYVDDGLSVIGRVSSELEGHR